MSQEKVDLEPKWYVIHTYSGYENKVKADLEQKVKNQEMEEYFLQIMQRNMEKNVFFNL